MLPLPILARCVEDFGEKGYEVYLNGRDDAGRKSAIVALEEAASAIMETARASLIAAGQNDDKARLGSMVAIVICAAGIINVVNDHGESGY